MKNGGGLLNNVLQIGLTSNKVNECAEKGMNWTTGSRCGFFRSSAGCCVPRIGGSKKSTHKKRTHKKSTHKKRTHKKSTHKK